MVKVFGFTVPSSSGWVCPSGRKTVVSLRSAMVLSAGNGEWSGFVSQTHAIRRGGAAGMLWQGANARRTHPANDPGGERPLLVAGQLEFPAWKSRALSPRLAGEREQEFELPAGTAAQATQQA